MALDLSINAPNLEHLLHVDPGSGASPDAIALSDDPAYIAHLTTLSLDALRAEPTTLSSTSAQLTNALTTLCHTSYPTFLSLHAASTALSSTLSTLSTSLSSLLTTLPALQDSAKSFQSTATPLLAERRHALLVREHAPILADVLALPRLLDACVRSGAHGDALDLAAHARALAAQFPDIPLVADIAAEAAAAEHTLLTQLLSTLAESGRGRLPTLFRAVNLLRRMRALPEPELALAFLRGRLGALDSTLSALEVEHKAAVADSDSDSEPRFVRKYAEAWREGSQDLLTQYSTIFLERAPGATANSSMPTFEQQALLRTQLSSAARTLVTRLRIALAAHLPAVRTRDPAALAGALTQLTYAGAAFARSGLDLRGILAPMFVEAVRSGVRTELQAALDLWRTRLSTVAQRCVPPSRWLISSGVTGTPPDGEEGPKKPPHIAPRVLSVYPPLAELTNALLTTLNGLRLLAPTEVLPDVLVALDNMLAGSARAFLEWVRQAEKQHTAEGEARICRAGGSIFARVLVPFARRALVEGVYGVIVNRESGPKLTKASGKAADDLKDIMGEWDEWLGDDEDESEDEDDDEGGDDDNTEDLKDQEEADNISTGNTAGA